MFPIKQFLCCICWGLFAASAWAQGINQPENGPGRIPRDETGRELNLNFETGDLRDWTATGDAWKGQPDKGGVDASRPFGNGKRSLHTGEYWIGGYEVVGDGPQGTLSSVPFKVDAPWCSFLVGGGSSRGTRVELVLAKGNQVISTQLGNDEEEMHPVVLNLEQYTGQFIFIRLVDEVSGGWGHVNFDDFRFYDQKPIFKELPVPLARVFDVELYPYQNLSGIEAAKVMQVPPGFKVQCAASEPDVRQPIAMAIDDRGRIWIAEAYEYPQRAEPGAGRDRILIFEDTDLDGTLDRRTVFIEGLNLISGFELGFGGVYVGAPPYLMFIPDRNGDDIPDIPELDAATAADRANLQFPQDVPASAEVLLDGWAWQDTHETLNAFTWGPDGWLYGCHGVFTHSQVGKPGTPAEKRVKLNAGIWRFHPVRQKFELFSEGTSNPWGIDFNEMGDAFCTACVIPHLYYLIPNGRYQRQAGNHFNQYTYRDIPTIARHRHYVGNQWNQSDRRASDLAGGGHAHAGAMIYQGGAWPEEYNGKLFMHNIHGNRVNVDQLLPEGSGYVGDRFPDFLLTGDKWSQMINLQYGPDGQVWMIDWYDQEQCHRREVDVVDRGNGRIYRVSFGDAPQVQVDLQKLSDAELVEHALTAKNAWYARHARRILQERAANAGQPESAIESTVKKALTDPAQALRALWLANVTGYFATWPEFQMDTLLAHSDPHVRAWSVRLLVQHVQARKLTKSLLQHFARMAADDPSPIVRLELASACGTLPLDDRWLILERLVIHREDARDHNIPFLIWYAMEPLAATHPQRALALGMTAGETIPLLRELMIRRLGSGQPGESLKLLVEGLAQAQDDDVRLTFLKGMRGALVGVRGLTPPPGWSDVYQSLVTSGQQSRNFDVYLYALGLGAHFGDRVAADDLQRIVVDEAGPQAERRIAFAFLVEDRDPRLAEIIPQLLNGTSLRAEALKSIATQDNPQLGQAIINCYKTLNPDEQADARNTLASRPTYALPLLQAIEANRIPKSDLSADVVRQLRNLNRPDINALLEKVWGVVRESTVDTQAQIAMLTRLIEDSTRTPPDVELGRAIFARTCQQCHTLFGTGAKIGPDITGSNRTNLNYLLSNIVDPSAVMAKEYRPTIVATDDGRVITGILKEETTHAITLQTTNELITIPKDEIEDRKESEKSMMPDGLLNNLSPMEIRALAAYLSSPGQVAMRATPETVKRFFNDLNLTGWRPSREEDARYWSMEEGELIGRSPGLKENAFLLNELAFDDFHFTCEVKLVQGIGNSGIQFRSQPAENGEMHGLQTGIGPGWWGKLEEKQGRGLLVDNPAEQFVLPDQWNRYEIVAVGNRVQTFLNGHRVVDLNDPQVTRSGVIALQLHSGGPMEVRFRHLQVKLLNSLPPYSALGAPPGTWPASAPLLANQKIRWKKTTLDGLFRSEGCCVADFDNDGDLDIASGSVWYEHPDRGSEGLWKQHPILEKPAEFNPNGYSDTFLNFADDLNADGWMDLIVVSYPGNKTSWFANPGTGTATGEDADPEAIDVPWKQYLMISVTSNESPRYLDINNDGQRELLSGVQNRVMASSSPSTFPQAPWKMTSLSESGAPGTDMYSHGLGAGDLNGDGRADLVITSGWWEQPAEATRNTWRFHQAVLGQPCSQMYVYDFDDDGDADVLSASAHRSGIWWHEQRRPVSNSEMNESTWKEHLIDASLSQTHALELADINGDGLPDFVTGRRHWAHNGNDPGEDQPAILAWYEFQKTATGPDWIRHTIDEDSGVGTQFEVADINQDGLLDIIVSNKKGTFLLEQIRLQE